MRLDPIGLRRILFRAMSVPFSFGMCLYCLLHRSIRNGGKLALLVVVCLAVFADLWKKEFSRSSMAVCLFGVEKRTKLSLSTHHHRYYSPGLQ